MMATKAAMTYEIMLIKADFREQAERYGWELVCEINGMYEMRREATREENDEAPMR